MLHQEKPALDENLLEHHGIKGMKWGARKAVSRADIKTARKSVKKDARAHLKNQAKFVVGKSSRQSLRDTRLKFLTNPDRATAARLTKGETALMALLAPVGGVSVIGTSQIQSRLVESRQRDGYLRPDGSGKIRRFTG